MSGKRLEDKVAWVTGSSRGMGRVIADHLADLGSKVAVHDTSLTSTRTFNETESLNAVAKVIAAAHESEVLPGLGRSDQCSYGPSRPLTKFARSSARSIFW